MVEVMKIMATSFKRFHACIAALSASDSEAGHHQRTPPLEVSWTVMGMSGLVLFGVTAPVSWVLVCTWFCLFPPRVCFPSPV